MFQSATFTSVNSYSLEFTGSEEVTTSLECYPEKMSSATSKERLYRLRVWSYLAESNYMC